MTEKEIKLVEENICLAVYVAKQWAKKTRMDMDDALSATQYGLVKASMTFDPARGFQFSTYAVRITENEIRMDLRRERRRIKTVSLDEPVKNADDLLLEDMIPDTRDCFGLYEAAYDLKVNSSFLTRKEYAAVMVRIKYPEKSQAECGRMIGISQSLFSRRLHSARTKMVKA